MCVLCLKLTGAITLSNGQTLVTYNLPSYILEKIYSLTGASTGSVSRASVNIMNDIGTIIDNSAVIILTKHANDIAIGVTGTYSSIGAADLYIRIQFDLLIDND